IGENNMFSLQSVIHRLVRRLRGRPVAVSKRIPAGRETWVDTEEGKLLVRQMDMRWFKDQWRGRGFSIQRHVAGQFTELYYKVSSPFLRKLTHLFNHIWFKYIKCPSPALGNILMVQKRK
nr:hypothetical protein [Candidatus Krumholzibacteriota bacterium]